MVLKASAGLKPCAFAPAAPDDMLTQTSYQLFSAVSLSSMMKMVQRCEKLRNCQFFPVLQSSGIFAAAPVTSTSVISDVLFKFGDFGVRIPKGIHNDEYLSMLVSTSDYLFTSFGENKQSILMNILRSIRYITAEEIESIAGDILFNIVDKNYRIVIMRLY